MAREILAYGLQATMVTVVPTGASALLINPVPGEVTSVLKYFAGASLEIMQATVGSTTTNYYTQGQTYGSNGPSLLGVTAGTGYLMGVGEALTFDGAVRYYLCATGSTNVTAYILRGLAQGF